MSNNIGLPSADNGTLQVNLNYDWNDLQDLRSEGTSLSDDSRQRETHSLLLEVGYSISSKFSLDLFVPVIRQERTIVSPLGSTDFDKTQGLGDLVILPKYALTEKIILGLGVKIPTGQSNKTSDGFALGADLQPGSGALDGIFYLAYSDYINSRKSFGYFGNVIFRKTGKNNSYLGSSTYQFGNEFQVIAGVADRFVLSSLQIDPSLKIRYRKAGRDFFDESEFPGSGGTFLFVNPGISVVVSPAFSWQINTSLPLHSFVNETQLSPTIQVNTGFLFRVNLKQNKIDL
ncbi:MAG: hypothetical protein ABJP45_12400 [Cyclobacteriaceae bacterium]